MSAYRPGDRVAIRGVFGSPEHTGVVLDTPGVMPGRTPVRVDGDSHTITLVLDENLTRENS